MNSQLDPSQDLMNPPLGSSEDQDTLTPQTHTTKTQSPNKKKGRPDHTVELKSALSQLLSGQPITGLAGSYAAAQEAKNAPKEQVDFIAIGDMVIDAFIRLDEKSRARIITHEDDTENKNAQKEIAMPFGDKIPFDFAKEISAVGNSANAAVSARRLGMSSGLVVNIGDDRDGQKCIAQLKKDNVSADFVRIHEGKKTNYHYVLWFKDERTILIKHEEYEYSLPDIGTPKCLYLSSVSENALPFHDTIAAYLDKHPEVKLVFQPGTFQMKWGTDALKHIYERTDLFFCNKEEAARILKIESTDIRTLLDGLRELGPKRPVITNGPDGAYTYGTDVVGQINFQETIYLPIYPDIAPPYERTGAGDAFASTFSVAMLLGCSIADCLKWASVNSMSVCQHVGAQEGLLTKVDISNFLKKAPKGWDIQVIK